MTANFRDEQYDRVQVRRSRAPMGERPASPVEELDEYITADQIAQLEAFVGKQWMPDDLDEYKETLTALFDVVDDARAQLAEIEAVWTSENRPWFYWGISEIKAERAALSVNKRLVERALSRCSGLIRSRNRAENQRQAAEAAARKGGKLSGQQRAAQQAAFTADPEFNRARREVMACAFKIAGTEHDFPEMWELRSALDEYKAQRERLREQTEGERES